MAPLISALAGLALAASGVRAAVMVQSAEEMGPATIMWPPGRQWSTATDNMAPCGSVAGVDTNRTKFPLKNGKVSLVAQEESWDIKLSISYLPDPKSEADFSTLMDPNSIEAFRSIDPGHTCVTVDDSPPSVRAGSNATLQIKYTSKFDKPERETFYACSDITFVELSDFAERVPCFNATRPKSGKGTGDGHSGQGSGSASSDSSGSNGVPAAGSGLSAGVIAGVVVGCVAGASLLGAAALVFWNRHKQQRRRLGREQYVERGVNWEEKPSREAT